MRKLRELEGMLIRVESALAVVLVLTMLTLAGYNVLYRNVLVPLQVYWAHSGPPIDPNASSEAAADATPEAKADPVESKEAKPDEVDKDDKSGGDDFGGFGGGFDGDEDEAGAGAEPEAKAGGDDFGGFGGGFDEDEEEEPAPAPEPKPESAPPAPEPAPKASDDFGGFGGGFDEDEEEEPAKPAAVAKADPPPAGDDGFGGFGGGFGEDEPKGDADGGGADDFGGFGGGAGEGDDAAADDAGEDDLGEDDLGDDDFGDDEDMFANLPSIDAVAKPQADEGPVGGPPPAGSFAARGIEFIDSIKLEWIDVFLRQLVIMVSFLGASLATHRRKHINIDALSKILPAPAQRVIPVVLNLVSLYVCIMLAGAGWDLVKIGQEYPNEILPWAQEWQIQLMFPVGFGLLAFHFALRLVESVVDPSAGAEPEVKPLPQVEAAEEPAPAPPRDSEPDSEAVTKNDGRPEPPPDGESSDDDPKGGSN
ncbi:MAG: TRAP transporter small permease [Myxococcota bacterium]